MLVRNFDRFNHLFWGPWNAFEQLTQDLDRVQGTLGSRFPAGEPKLNVWIHEDGAVVTALAPGVRLADVDIGVRGDTLTVSYKRPAPEPEAGQSVRSRELSFGSFARQVTLPFVPDADQVEATFRSGLLEVRLPRSATDKPRRIAVSTSH